MANGSSNDTIFGPDLSLTPDQQNLLRTALSSNNPDSSFNPGTGNAGTKSVGDIRSSEPGSNSVADSVYQATTQDTLSPLIDEFPLDDSPFAEAHDFEDGNFDWDNGEDQLFGDLPEAHGGDELHEKRKNGENEDGKNKRHEGNDKNSKKPGRKPLNSSEPTTVSLILFPSGTTTNVRPNRNARHKIALPRERSASAKNVISKTSKPKSRTLKRHQRLPTMRTAVFGRQWIVSILR